MRQDLSLDQRLRGVARPLLMLAATAALGGGVAGCGGSDDDAGADQAAAEVSDPGRSVTPTITTLDGTPTTPATGADDDAAAKKKAQAKKGSGSDKGSSKKGSDANSSSSEDPTPSSSGGSSSSSSSSGTTKKRSGSTRKRSPRKRSSGSSGGGGGAGSPAAAAPAAKRLGPLPTGSFAFDTSGKLEGGGRTATMPSTTQLEVSGAGGGAQRQVRDLRNGSGEGPMSATVLTHDDAGVHLRSLELRGKLGAVNDQRTLTGNDPLFLSATPQNGESHQFSLSGSGVTAQVSVKVGGKDSVAGTEVTRVDVRVEYSGEVRGSTDQELYLSASGFPVRERVVSNLQFRVGSSRTEYTVTARQVPGGG